MEHEIDNVAEVVFLGSSNKKEILVSRRGSAGPFGGKAVTVEHAELDVRSDAIEQVYSSDGDVHFHLKPGSKCFIYAMEDGRRKVLNCFKPER